MRGIERELVRDFTCSFVVYDTTPFEKSNHVNYSAEEWENNRIKH